MDAKNCGRIALPYDTPNAMTGGQAMDQSLATPRFINRVLLTLMGILVSMVAFLAIIHRWHAFSSVAKFDAIIFLLILVTNPLFELLAEKRGQTEFSRFLGSFFGYILALLAIMIFATH
jgi:hypothetical protein